MGVYTHNEYQEIIDNRKRNRTTSTHTANETLRPSIHKEVAKFHVGHLYIAAPIENSKSRGRYSAQRILPFSLYKELAKRCIHDRIFIPIPKLKPKEDETMADFIWSLHCKGYQIKVIAKNTRLSTARIYQIIQRKYGNCQANRTFSNHDIWKYQFEERYLKDLPEASPEELFEALRTRWERQMDDLKTNAGLCR